MAPKVSGLNHEETKNCITTKKKKRRKYKKYNLFGSTANIPARTQSRWRKKSIINQ